MHAKHTEHALYICTGRAGCTRRRGATPRSASSRRRASSARVRATTPPASHAWRRRRARSGSTRRHRTTLQAASGGGSSGYLLADCAGSRRQSKSSSSPSAAATKTATQVSWLHRVAGPRALHHPRAAHPSHFELLAMGLACHARALDGRSVTHANTPREGVSDRCRICSRRLSRV